MDVFKQLTRGIKFDVKRFSEEANKFGLKPKTALIAEQTVETEPLVDLNEFKRRKTLDDSDDSEDELPSSELEDESNDAVNNGHDEDSSGNDDEETLTLLGDVKARSSTKSKDKKKQKKMTREKRLRLHRENLKRFRKLHKIHVNGTDIPEPIDSWSKLKEEYGCPEELLEAISKHYTQPTPIQMQAIPLMLERRELLGCAPTGSGKTAAYLIPLIHLLQEPRNSGFRALIVAPTRELAHQIQRETLKFAECRGLKSLILDPLSKATKKFTPKTAKRYDILISTPNRLAFMLKDELISLKQLEWLIVDESDKLFEAGPRGFRDQLAVIYRACDEANIRRAMFSATFAPDFEAWCKLNFDNVVLVTVGIRNTATQSVEQKLIYTGTEKGKLLAMRQIIKEGLKPPVLIFVQSKERAKELHQVLSKEDIRVDMIHSERSQLQRDKTVTAFRAGRVWVLICTELLGRGIDFKGVNLVINYDFPPSTISYIHRIGRTGRAGKRGKAITFFNDEDKVLLRSIATIVKDAGGEVPEYMLQMKKASRQAKRQLARKAVERENIIQESKYDKAKRLKKEEMIAASKRRKRKAMTENNKENGDAENPEEEKKFKRIKLSKDEKGHKPKKKKKNTTSKKKKLLNKK